MFEEEEEGDSSLRSYEICSTHPLTQANLDANFEDRNAFVIGMAKYSEEAAQQSKLQEMLDQGQRHAVKLKMIMMLTMMMIMIMTRTMTVLVAVQRKLHAEQGHEEKTCPDDMHR